ncbi:hypothetical protein Poly30_13480 [Planctomycetes bacterium Poly30]|uniref:RNA polymerase sigma factor n=1 Tax=Saltatorellus ferox TaxID=2528018 RepID=A0A518EP36_9BACT|nr:hypothetical protein Poly30_13480 [Planctomycetes bacterium Poly30]
MHAWSQPHRLRRHDVQRQFEALERLDVVAVARWRDESGVTAMLRGAFTGARAAFLAAATDGAAPGCDALIARWTTLFAERAQGEWQPGFALDWWLDRVGVWLEGEVRQRHGAAISRSLVSAHRRQTGAAPDRLALDAMFAAAVAAAVDGCERYESSEPLGPWLAGVAYVVAREYARVEERRALALPRADVELDAVAARRVDAVSRFEDAEVRDWLVQRALRGVTLRGEHAIVVNLLDGGERSAESLGEELSISVKRVYKRTAAARVRLRDAMERFLGR